MTAVILNILVIGILCWSLYYGWHRGAPRQLPATIGWLVAVIAVRILTPDLAGVLERGGMTGYTDGDLAARWLAVTIVYICVFSLITMITSPLGTILRIIVTHTFASIAGAVLAALRVATLLSILLNLWSATDQDCLALQIANGGDGGIVEGTMHIAPLLTGQEDFEETIVRRQLREAQTISLLYPLSLENIS